MATRTDTINYIFRRLGCPNIKVELTDTQVDDAINEALQRYIEFSSAGTRKTMYVLDVLKDITTYSLPADVTQVIKVVSSTSARALTTNVVDPYLNVFNYRNRAGMSLVEIGTAYLENVQRMFSKIYEFDTYKVDDNGVIRLDIEFTQVIRANTKLVLVCERKLAETVLLEESWIKDYILARCKIIVGEERSKFSAIAGPGGVSLNGGTLLQQGNAEISYLEEKLQTRHRRPIGFLIG
jgi:hypothetical protein